MKIVEKLQIYIPTPSRLLIVCFFFFKQNITRHMGQVHISKHIDYRNIFLFALKAG